MPFSLGIPQLVRDENAEVGFQCSFELTDKLASSNLSPHNKIPNLPDVACRETVCLSSLVVRVWFVVVVVVGW